MFFAIIPSYLFSLRGIIHQFYTKVIKFCRRKQDTPNQRELSAFLYAFAWVSICESFVQKREVVFVRFTHLECLVFMHTYGVRSTIAHNSVCSKVIVFLKICDEEKIRSITTAAVKFTLSKI